MRHTTARRPSGRPGALSTDNESMCASSLAAPPSSTRLFSKPSTRRLPPLLVAAAWQACGLLQSSSFFWLTSRLWDFTPAGFHPSCRSAFFLFLCFDATDLHHWLGILQFQSRPHSPLCSPTATSFLNLFPSAAPPLQRVNLPSVCSPPLALS